MQDVLVKCGEAKFEQKRTFRPKVDSLLASI
jgi:hypothetical protein